MALLFIGYFSSWRAQAQSADRPPIHVIVIGVDGLSVDGVEKAATPRLHELMNRGAWTLAARGVMPTLSSPNWLSALGGAGPEAHAITSNGYFRRLVEFEPVCHDADGKFPTIFGLLRQQRPENSSAVFHDWRGLADLIEKQAPTVMRHERGATRTADKAMAYWVEHRPSLMFVHLDNVDHAGHSSGWFGWSYYAAIEEADRRIGQILDTVTQESAWNSTYVLVTSDHGGTRKGHGKNSLAELQIPWILAGPDVPAGRILDIVNTYDTAATLAWLFDLTPPQCWTGRPVLSAFRRRAREALPATTAAQNACATEILPCASLARQNSEPRPNETPRDQR